jgi:hypothetical protein
MLADLYVESVLAKCEALKNGGIWATEPHIRPSAWLDNFSDPQERLLAAILLDNFVFYSDRASARLLASAYYRFEDDVILGRIANTGAAQAFLDALVFTPVEGEHPRPTDSGKTLYKRLRDLTELDDQQFFEPAAALEKAHRGSPVVFVDDFLGSGNQMIETWERRYAPSRPFSFNEAHANCPFVAICLAMVATQEAIRNIAASAAAPVHVIAAHILDDSYSVQKLVAPTLTPPLLDLQVSLRAMLERHSPNLILPAFLTADQVLFGFHELGLLFAVQGGVPDSAVPLLWASGHGNWIRLVRKNA